jgi:hypothetical protein
VFLWLANWWDGVDLWLSQLAFPFQFAIVIAVLAPVCLGLAWLIDHVVDLVPGLFSGGPKPGRRVTERVPEAPVSMHGRADVPAGTPGLIITGAPQPTARRGPESSGS